MMFYPGKAILFVAFNGAQLRDLFLNTIPNAARLCSYLSIMFLMIKSVAVLKLYCNLSCRLENDLSLTKFCLGQLFTKLIDT